ncbi:NAD(P)/FAD-dependent oxidoreductase [Gemmatimonas groenlandica]|uniref:FAD-binding oxidoreductase n=1 Tax=Gemmatimonas groenlandica TaxID=2732249 RepID=A0A6M4IS22_9BACT|nr:FAD-dependent oxidoreductase [Gemmatimonas groenlandica]QJR36945.1 FAD-binding oxidoreductase [Gemmatimonas groenlandica]
MPHTPLPANGMREIIDDVVVVGTGISGALVAHALIEAGRSVTMLDRRPPMTGSTLASTALLQFEIDLPLHRLARQVGWPRARRAYQRSVRAVQDLTALVRREGIRCAFGARESLYLAGDAYGARALAVEVDAREKAGVPGEFLPASEVRSRYGIARTGAIVSAGSATADPAQLTAGVLRRIVSRSGRIWSGVNVTGVDSSLHGVELSTEQGQRVFANQVVFCTGYETPTHVPTRDHRIHSTWAVASAPNAAFPAWLARTVVWEASDPYLYLRTTADGRLIAGGHDEEAASAYTVTHRIAAKARAIQHDVHALLPDTRFRVSHAWGGAFGESTTALPLIDRLPDTRHTWVVAGFGGNGITYSMIAAQVIAAALQGARDPDAGLFILR